MVEEDSMLEVIIQDGGTEKRVEMGLDGGRDGWRCRGREQDGRDNSWFLTLTSIWFVK